MRITGLDHYNIAAPVALLDQVRDFYCDVLGLTRGHRPAFDSDGYWLYAGTRALVHLKVIAPEAVASVAAMRRTGWFAHIAFRCSGLDAYRARLDGYGIPYEIDASDELKQVQLFLTDPAGVNVELNFAGPDAA